MTSSTPVRDDLQVPMATESADEARLLELYRSSSWADRNRILFSVTRLHFAPFISENFDNEIAATEPTYQFEELEEALRVICPRERLVEACPDLGIAVCFNGFWQQAWGRIAPVVLGSDEQDGRRADELFSTVNSYRSRRGLLHGSFTRQDALRLIEEWRENMLENIFACLANLRRARDEQRGNPLKGSD